MSAIQRYASVVRLRADKEGEYRRLHSEVWPGVLDALRRSHISNYSIFLRDGLLFSYLEYGGNDYDADMTALAADGVSRRWCSMTDPCQQPLSSIAAGELWAPATEVFHLD